MTRLTLLLSVACVSLLPVTHVTAQEAQPDSALVRAATATLKSDLRNFATAQERYFPDHMAYASSLKDLAYQPSPGVTVVLLLSTPDGYIGHSEIAIDERVPGLVCAMYIGDDDIPHPLGRGEEGEVVCRGP